jgi:hypothetical protein
LVCEDVNGVCMLCAHRALKAIPGADIKFVSGGGEISGDSRLWLKVCTPAAKSACPACTCMCMCMCMRMHMCIHVHVHAHAHVHTCTCAYMHMCMCMHMHMLHMHMYLHVHAQSPAPSPAESRVPCLSAAGARLEQGHAPTVQRLHLRLRRLARRLLLDRAGEAKRRRRLGLRARLRLRAEG